MPRVCHHSQTAPLLLRLLRRKGQGLSCRLGRRRGDSAVAWFTSRAWLPTKQKQKKNRGQAPRGESHPSEARWSSGHLNPPAGGPAPSGCKKQPGETAAAHRIPESVNLVRAVDASGQGLGKQALCACGCRSPVPALCVGSEGHCSVVWLLHCVVCVCACTDRPSATDPASKPHRGFLHLRLPSRRRGGCAQAGIRAWWAHLRPSQSACPGS